MRRRGFTAVELLVVLAVVAVLATLAYPSLQAAVSKVRRSDALVLLGQVQLAQARHRSQHRRYARLADLGFPSTTPAGHHVLSEEDPREDGYAVVARAVGAQASDAPCRYLALRVEGAETWHRSGPSPDLGNGDEGNRRCWGH